MYLLCTYYKYSKYVILYFLDQCNNLIFINSDYIFNLVIKGKLIKLIHFYLHSMIFKSKIINIDFN